MAGLRGFTIDLVAIILCVLFVILFAYNFIVSTNPSSDLMNSKYGLNQSITNYNSALGSYNTLANDISSQLSSSQVSPADYLFLIFRGAFTIPITIFKTVGMGIGLLMVTINSGIQSTGIGSTLSVIIMAIGTGLLITAVLLVISAIRTGSSER